MIKIEELNKSFSDALNSRRIINVELLVSLHILYIYNIFFSSKFFGVNLNFNLKLLYSSVYNLSIEIKLFTLYLNASERI